MANVTGQCSPSISFQQKPSSGILANQALSINDTIQVIFKAAGILADQVDTIHAKTYNFVASTPQTLDLQALTDILGNAISFARVRLFAVKILSTVDGSTLTIGAAGANEWDGFLSNAGTITCFPSTTNADGSLNNHGFLILSAPNITGAVVSGTSHLLKLLPSANAFSVDVIIAGCSA